MSGALRAEAPLRRILVIKHGALGDFAMAAGPFQAIRRHHPQAHITLLTTPAFVRLAELSGCFDAVWEDPRPPVRQWRSILALRRRLRAGRFQRVYDLQTSTRTAWYFRLWPRRERPEWSGIAVGCSHPHRDPQRRRMHTIDRQRAQLRAAGIAEVPFPDLGWAAAASEARHLVPEGPFALLVPGGAAHRGAKRWPAAHYAALAERLAGAGLSVAVLGGESEAALAAAIRERCPAAIDLTGRTALEDIALIAAHADLAVGNDTGPMHVAALNGAPTVVLFSHASDPARTAPRGSQVQVLRRASLSDLSVDEVWESIASLLPAAQAPRRSVYKGPSATA